MAFADLFIIFDLNTILLDWNLTVPVSTKQHFPLSIVY